MSAKKTGAHSEVGQTGGSKQLRAQLLTPGQPAEFKASTRRVYTRDYRKANTDAQDTVTPFVGNPLIF